jgi:hypothetical protein
MKKAIGVFMTFLLVMPVVGILQAQDPSPAASAVSAGQPVSQIKSVKVPVVDTALEPEMIPAGFAEHRYH